MALEVQIKKKLGKFQLDTAFTVESGMFAILGASGCGKSMTLKCIAGIERPDEGRIVLDGHVLFDSEKKINLPPKKRKVGYMFQDYALFPTMTVEQNIRAGMGKKANPQEVQSYIRRFHLTGLEKHRPAQLSGGQKQRVAMARMLAAKPELLLFDEPFSALDSHLKWKLQQEMQQTFYALGKPALFVSHNRDEVYQLCDTVGCMNQGKLEVIEPVKEFFHNPKTVTAAMLSGCKNISPVVKNADGTIAARDWGLRLCIPDMPENIAAVGIRAHDFCTVQENGENVLTVHDGYVAEDMFEWTYFVRSSTEHEWIQWKIAKQDWQADTPKLPKYLKINAEKLLFLQS